MFGVSINALRCCTREHQLTFPSFSPFCVDAQADLAAAALARIAAAGGAAACSAELGGEALGADVALLCRALSLSAPSSAASLPPAPDARRAAALAALAAALDEVLERRVAALPSSAAAPVGVALAAALRSAEAARRASPAAEPPLAALRALGALLQVRRGSRCWSQQAFAAISCVDLSASFVCLFSTQDHGQSVPPADAPALAAALLPWASPPPPDSRAATPEPLQGDDAAQRRQPRLSVSASAGARREPSRLALGALGALCSRLGAAALPPAQAAAALAAAAAARGA